MDRLTRFVSVTIHGVKLQVEYDFWDGDQYEINAIRVMDDDAVCPVDIFKIINWDEYDYKICEAIESDIKDRREE